MRVRVRVGPGQHAPNVVAAKMELLERVSVSQQRSRHGRETIEGGENGAEVGVGGMEGWEHSGSIRLDLKKSQLHTLLPRALRAVAD